MRDGPDISQIGALIGDPARANILAALMDGRALTATELSEIAGVTAQTASTHLAKLEAGGLIRPQKQGRHKYFSLSGPQAGQLIESLMDFAADRGHLRHRPGPRDEAMRKARICYDHLAGDLGVLMFDSLVSRRHLNFDDTAIALTGDGESFLTGAGIDLATLRKSRRPLCRCCLDWSERRDHLAGSLGAALFDMIIDKGWARRDAASRAIAFTPPGETAFRKLFPLNAERPGG
ncbi:MAG: transcriptional regulator protein [Rhizobium sp.]|nr:transcriptional regulator protein [Rhizobium sp.]